MASCWLTSTFLERDAQMFQSWSSRSPPNCTCSTAKGGCSLGGDERPPFLFPSRASFSQRGPLVSSGCRPRGSTAAANNHPGRRADCISLPRPRELHEHHPSDRQTETCLSPPGVTPGTTSAQWAAVVPTLIISSDPHIGSDEDVLLPAKTPVAVLQAIESVDSTDIQFTVAVNELVVSRETACRSADSAPADHVPCPDFDGTSSQRNQ